MMDARPHDAADGKQEGHDGQQQQSRAAHQRFDQRHHLARQVGNGDQPGHDQRRKPGIAAAQKIESRSCLRTHRRTRHRTSPGDACRRFIPVQAGWRCKAMGGREGFNGGVPGEQAVITTARCILCSGGFVMSFAIWALIIGAMMITMALAGSLLKRLPLSASMLYLAAGYGVGMTGLWPLMPNPADYAAVLERVSEVALLISL
jgi:hypothetical protein